MDEARFNQNHGAAGSSTGGQFVSAGGGGGGSKTPAKKAPAKKPPPGKAPAGKGHGKPPPAHTPREKLLAEAHADREKAAKLEKQLHVLEKQHAVAAAAAKHAASQAAKAKAAGHPVHHRHTAAHHRHRKHAATLATRIGHLRTEIHTLRQKAAALEKQAKTARSLPGFDDLDERAVSELPFGHGSALWKYWTAGKGFAKWSGALHKWTTLRDLLLKAGVPAHSVDGLTTNIIMAVMPGYMKLAHAKGGGGMNSSGPDGEFRTVPFDLESSGISGDGLTFSGYAAVYNRTARIRAADGDFDEQIMPGAFRAIAEGNYPVLMFEHGRHPLIGTMPLGRMTDAREDDIGLWIEARLTDNWLISPVRDAVANEALDGMSFRFTVNGDDGEDWATRSGDVPLRSLISLNVPELGPVVFPAYEPTTASVRSVLDNLPVIGRPPAGDARAASGREEGGAPQERAEPDPTLSDRFRRDGEALALRGIQGVRLR